MRRESDQRSRHLRRRRLRHGPQRHHGKPAWSPMGSTANINGRIIAQNIMGKELRYRGSPGTAVCQLPGLNVGRTGLTEAQAKAEALTPSAW